MFEEKNLRERAIDDRLSRAFRHYPCVVTALNLFIGEEPSVNVIIALDHILRQDQRTDGRQQHVEIRELPIAYQSTSTGAFTLGISEGDSGWLWFSDRDLDEWQFEDAPTSGQGRRRISNMNDAAFYPGVWKRVKALEGYNPDALEMRSVSGKARVIVSDDTVHINAENIIMNGIPIVTVNPITGVALDPGGDPVPVNRP